MKQEFCLVEGERILTKPAAYESASLAQALRHHGVPVGLLPQFAPTEPLQLHHLQLLPVVDITVYPEEHLELYHQGQAQLVVEAERVALSYPLTPYPLDYCRDLLKGYIESLRYDKQEAGISVNDVPVLTAKYHRDMLRDTVDSIRDGVITSVRWKGPAGWFDAGLAELEPLRNAIVLHIQVCFAHENTLHEALDNAGDFDAVLTVAADIPNGWPATL